MNEQRILEILLGEFHDIHNKSIRKVQTNPKKIFAVDTGLVKSVTLDNQSELGIKGRIITLEDYLKYGVDFLIDGC